MASAMTEELGVDAESVDATAGRDRSARLALIVFVAVEIVALVVILIYGHTRWFFNDDWDFLAQRSLTSVSDLLRPHYEHWVTIPVVAYRILWSIFGARTYLPYQLLVVLAHLGVAALLRVVMRRSGVGPWVATGAASLFALFGAGYDNMFSAFQITFVGSLLFGLTQLLLADHDGRIDRRDWLGLAAGLAALMCSLVGIAMVVAVGVATLLRRGWRVALFHTLPLAYLFVSWWLIAGGHTYAGYHAVGQIFSFVRIGFTATFEALGQWKVFAVLLAVVLVVGLLLAWAPLRGAALRRRSSLPAALLTAALSFMLITGWGRSGRGNGPAVAFSVEHARESRYLHVVAALVLPALAVAGAALIRRWRVLAPVFVIVLVVAVVGNVRVMAHQRDTRGPIYVAYRRMILELPRMPRAGEFPGNYQPDPRLSSGLTMQWLRNAARSGKLPAPDPPPTSGQALTQLAITALPFGPRLVGAPCRSTSDPVDVTLDKGDRLTIEGFPRMTLTGPGGQTSDRVPYLGVLAPPYGPWPAFSHGQSLQAEIGPLDLHIAPFAPLSTSLTICVLRAAR
jgi:hypothetical protein